MTDTKAQKKTALIDRVLTIFKSSANDDNLNAQATPATPPKPEIPVERPVQTPDDVQINQPRQELKSIDILPEQNVKARHDVRLAHDLDWRYPKKTLSDHFAQAACDSLGWVADTFFKKRYGHRAVVLETVAAIPGTVAAFHHQFNSLRRVEANDPRIRAMMDEAENERMHLMIFAEISKPNRFEKALIWGAQAFFFTFFAAAYVLHQKAAHRFVGLIEEKAVDSYTQYLKEIDEGRIENIPAPKIAKEYYNLPDDARLRDVVICVRHDEANHRDENHHFADALDHKKGGKHKVLPPKGHITLKR